MNDQHYTTYYKVKIEDAKRFFKTDGANLILQKAFELFNWDIFDMEHTMFGSRVIDNVLYICSTDGEPLYIDHEEVDPEYALDRFAWDIDLLDDYIRPATAEVVRMHLSEYELNIDFIIDELDTIAMDLLKHGEHFADVAIAAKDLGLLDE